MLSLLSPLKTVFRPDFEAECKQCGHSPCVTVEGLEEFSPDLCGPCYFKDPLMLDYWRWNEYEDTYLPDSWKTQLETDQDED